MPTKEFPYQDNRGQRNGVRGRHITPQGVPFPSTARPAYDGREFYGQSNIIVEAPEPGIDLVRVLAATPTKIKIRRVR